MNSFGERSESEKERVHTFYMNHCIKMTKTHRKHRVPVEKQILHSKMADFLPQEKIGLLADIIGHPLI